MRRVTVLALLAGCQPASTDTAADADSAPVTGYRVDWWTEPDSAEDGQEVEFYEHVTDQDGNSLDDLQRNHERYIHTVFVSHDLASFTHTHMEDYYEVTADAIRESTFHFPVSWPLSGDYLVIFDYARADQWLQTTDTLTVGGDVAQLDAPVEDFATSVSMGGLQVSLTWDVEPTGGYEAAWTVHITTADGEDVTDLTQWLGADGHCVIVDKGLGWASHTHAWFPDMDRMTPTMTMPHIYDGPDLPFHFVFPVGGTYKMWVQFVRSSEPDTVYAVPFMFMVAG